MGRSPAHRARMRMWRWPWWVIWAQLAGWAVLVLVLAGLVVYGALVVIWLVLWWALRLF